MKLDTAYCCYACREIQERAPMGTCSTCGSDNIHPLGWVGRSKKDRLNWLKRIGALRTRKGESCPSIR